MTERLRSHQEDELATLLDRYRDSGDPCIKVDAWLPVHDALIASGVLIRQSQYKDGGGVLRLTDDGIHYFDEQRVAKAVAEAEVARAEAEAAESRAQEAERARRESTRWLLGVLVAFVIATVGWLLQYYLG
ncbi:MAG: hypothetical protein HGB10_07310 [Coriobacteriia bacterium]|nr:hypothetical protein [Coriobacteriia bacterium]